MLRSQIFAGRTGAKQIALIWGHVQADAAEASPDAAGHFALPLLAAVTGSAAACLEAFVLQAGPPSAASVRCRSANTVLAGDSGIRTLSRVTAVSPPVDDARREPQAQASGAGAAQRPLRPLPGQSHKRARRRDPNTARWLMEALPSLHLFRESRAASLVLVWLRKTTSLAALSLRTSAVCVSPGSCPAPYFACIVVTMRPRRSYLAGAPWPHSGHCLRVRLGAGAVTAWRRRYVQPLSRQTLSEPRLAAWQG